MAVLLDSNAPHISRNDFDKEAIEFLERYYPEALQSPMAVPILEIARKRMGLRVVERRLSEDFSVLGQMCFTSGIEEIYVKVTCPPKVAPVSKLVINWYTDFERMGKLWQGKTIRWSRSS